MQKLNLSKNTLNISRNRVFPLLVFCVLATSRGYCDSTTPDTPNNQTVGGKASNTGSRIYENGAEVILDGSLHVTGASRTDKYLEIVAKSSITVPSANHVKVYLSSTTEQLCALFDNGKTGCISSNTIAGITAGYGLINTGTGSNPVINLNGSTTSYIQNTGVLQTATFTVTNGNVYGIFKATGTVTLGSSVGSVTFSTAPNLNNLQINNLSNGINNQDAAAFGQIILVSTPLYSSETTGGTTTSSSFVSIGAAVTINLLSSTSRVAIWEQAPCANNTLNANTVLGIERASTDLFTTTNSPARASQLANDLSAISLFYIDSPATTGNVTYQMRVAATAGGTSVVGAAAAGGAETQIMVWQIK